MCLRLHVGGLCEALVGPRAPIWMSRLLLRELGNPTEALPKVVDEFIRPNFEAIRACVAGLMPRNTKPLDVAMHALSVIGQCLHYRHTAPITLRLLSFADYPADFSVRLARHVLSVTFRAIGRADLAPGEAAS